MTTHATGTGHEPLAVCAAAGITDADLTAGDAYFLYGDILKVIGKEMQAQIFALQAEKKSAGDAEWFYWGVSPVEFLESKDEKYLAELRQRIGR